MYERNKGSQLVASKKESYIDLRKKIEMGQAKKKYYINKKGEIIQKITIHLPIDMVKKLKKEAID